eukprot:TRINITY_DN503_c0_g1_i1.p1 TRINITY_DN503_c0_g1~~TRINITY_DN503_c0_g1_i1.p1  ORF type:complete len:131 (-),score=14.20 TRINITY_DN503_c0_g1_i1:581-973(-)
MAMAASLAVASPLVGLRSSSLAPSRRLCIHSGKSVRRRASSMNTVTCFNRDWLRKDYSVIGFGLIGWMAPSSIPAINGNSLTGLFFQSIGNELSHWPTGPSLTSTFWNFPSVSSSIQTLTPKRSWQKFSV